MKTLSPPLSGGMDALAWCDFLRLCKNVLRNRRKPPFRAQKKHLDRPPNQVELAEVFFHYLYVRPQSIEISTFYVIFIFLPFQSRGAQAVQLVPQSTLFAPASAHFCINPDFSGPAMSNWMLQSVG